MHRLTAPAARCALLALALAGLAACDSRKPAANAGPAGGNSRQGARLIRLVGCGTCHEIPGIVGANGRVGPPLTTIGDRTFIAGVLPNTPANMIRWLQEPQSVIPGNAMPDMGLNDEDARDVAAYLYTLR